MFSHQEGCKTQKEMDVYNPSAREKEYIRQGKGVKPKGVQWFQEDRGFNWS